MPAFSFPVGTVLKAETVCTVPGQISVMVHKFQMTSLTGSTTFNSTDFLNQYDLDMFTNLGPLISNEATYYGTQVRVMNPIGPPPRPDNTVANTAPGTGGAGLMPTQASGLISWYTDLLGKQGQGRTYIPFPSPTQNATDGTPIAGYISMLGNLASYLRNNIVITVGGIAGTFEKVLYQGGIATPLFVDNATLRDAWATQRRRGAYGKANKNPW